MEPASWPDFGNHCLLLAPQSLQFCAKHDWHVSVAEWMHAKSEELDRTIKYVITFPLFTGVEMLPLFFPIPSTNSDNELH
jgi:hypothetical protein